MKAGKGDGVEYTAQRAEGPVSQWFALGPPVLELALHCGAKLAISGLGWEYRGWERQTLAGQVFRVQRRKL